MSFTDKELAIITEVQQVAKTLKAIDKKLQSRKKACDGHKQRYATAAKSLEIEIVKRRQAVSKLDSLKARLQVEFKGSDFPILSTPIEQEVQLGRES